MDKNDFIKLELARKFMDAKLNEQERRTYRDVVRRSYTHSILQNIKKRCKLVVPQDALYHHYLFERMRTDAEHCFNDVYNTKRMIEDRQCKLPFQQTISVHRKAYPSGTTKGRVCDSRG